MVYSCAPFSALDSVGPAVVVVAVVVVVVACESLLVQAGESRCLNRVDFRHAVDSSCCAEVMSRPTC